VAGGRFNFLFKGNDVSRRSIPPSGTMTAMPAEYKTTGIGNKIFASGSLRVIVRGILSIFSLDN
jgi:hypothetical protein